jgi:hypothetical protein
VLLRPRALLVTAMVLTQILAPHHYFELVFELAPTETWLLVARNLLLVTLVGVLLWPERTRRAALTGTASEAA